jgi:membrane-associated protease RseP (regulator of RpoE activity)
MLRNTRIFASLIAVLIAAVASAAPAADEQARKEAEAQKKLAEAQQRLEQAAQEVAEISMHMAEDSRDVAMFKSRNPNRAMLGIGLGGDDNDKESGDGVRVISVSPGGPAAGAGVKAGDLIVELNGQSLKRDKDDPNEKLLNEISAVKFKAEKLPRNAGAQVRIERHIIRDNHAPFDDEHEMETMHFPGFMGMGPFGSIEMVSLSPKLGQYFGTDKGLLIVRVPQDKELKLEDGDVLVDIDGRVPNNPSHAFRILNSYQPGEKVTMNVLRQRKRMSVAVVVPEFEQHEPRPPMPPMPPSTPRAGRSPVAPVPPVPPIPSVQPTT